MKIQKWSAEATGGDNTGWSEYHHLYSHNIIDTQPIQSQENGKNKKNDMQCTVEWSMIRQQHVHTRNMNKCILKAKLDEN